MKTESGPLCFFRSSIFALISFSAWSHEMRWYLPSTSFIGHLRRWSPRPCSRTAAPLAQCAPRLIGESNTGSWRTQTPFSTTASTAQPTEQWPQTVRLTSIFLSPPLAHASPASALRTRVSCEAARPAPTPRPERRRKARLSIVGMARESPRAKPETSDDDDAARSASDDLRVSNMMPPAGSWLNPGSNLGGLVVAQHVLRQLVAGGRVGQRLERCRGDGLGRGARQCLGGDGRGAGDTGAEQEAATLRRGRGAALGRVSIKSDGFHASTPGLCFSCPRQCCRPSARPTVRLYARCCRRSSGSARRARGVPGTVVGCASAHHHVPPTAARCAEAHPTCRADRRLAIRRRKNRVRIATALC